MAGGCITYDDTQLRRMLDELGEAGRAQMFRRAFAREATKVRRVAVTALLSSGLHNAGAMSKGIRSEVARKSIGFRVTARSGKGKGYHTNRRGLLKPVLMWAELGTAERSRKRGGRTGRMGSYGFMSKAADSCSTVQEALTEEIRRSIVSTAKKYGCN